MSVEKNNEVVALEPGLQKVANVAAEFTATIKNVIDPIPPETSKSLAQGLPLASYQPDAIYDSEVEALSANTFTGNDGEMSARALLQATAEFNSYPIKNRDQFFGFMFASAETGQIAYYVMDLRDFNDETGDYNGGLPDLGDKLGNVDNYKKAKAYALSAAQAAAENGLIGGDIIEEPRRILTYQWPALEDLFADDIQAI